MSLHIQLIIGCERSGIVRGYFRGLGVNAWSCDLADSEDGSPYHHKGDALTFMRANPQAGNE